MRASTSSLVLLAVLGLAGPARSQAVLDQFAYDSLHFSGVQLDAGAFWSDRLDPALIGGFRIDWGFFAPRIRLLTGVSYARSDFSGDEIARFEDRVRQIVIDPSGDDTVRVGSVELAAVVLDFDLQYLVVAPPQVPLLLYAGAGLSVQFRNGRGPLIDGTFVEDALDVVAAGLNGTVGLEVPVFPEVRLTLEGRGVLTSGLNGVSARAGLMYRFGAVP